MILTIAAVAAGWVALSIPTALIVGRLFAAGKTPEEQAYEDAYQAAWVNAWAADHA